MPDDDILVLFLRRDPDGEWRVVIGMNSHSLPIERIERIERDT